MNLINRVKRRHFLQGAAGALGAIGLSQLGLEYQATRYGKALAQDTYRKVALLVGINDYQGIPLDGALNDVELQRQLLIHRFGFLPDNVHVLKNDQASRHNILGAFYEYLYEPACEGDVIIFHFSGHGNRVRESDLLRDFLDRLGRNCVEGDKCWNTTIAPYGSEQMGSADDIMGHTLLLMRALLAQITDNVTFVLDCCYAGGGKRGNAIMRSLNEEMPANWTTHPPISDDEWHYQQHLLSKLGWDEQRFADEIQSPRGQGFFVGAAEPYQLAADYSFNGFTAGVFTYLLTHYLWHSSGPLSETIPMVRHSSTRLDEHTQKPDYDPKSDAVPAVSEIPIYHIDPVSQPAEALVLGASTNKAEDDTRSVQANQRVQLWLGGLEPWALDAFDQGAIFTLLDKTTGAELGEVEPIPGSRRQLRSEGRLLMTQHKGDSSLTGQLLHEKIRGIPNPVTLKIGLDETLSATEQQVVMDEFGALSEFEVLTANPGQFVHVLLGRYTEDIHQRLLDYRVPVRTHQAIGSIGLFSPAQEPKLVGSFGEPGEAIADAINNRLRSRFTSLYLGRLLALMGNQHSSWINVSVEVNHLGSVSGTTTRGGDPNAIIIPQQSARGIEQVAVGDNISITVKNHEHEDLHFGIVVIDAAGEVSVLFPPPIIDAPDTTFPGSLTDRLEPPPVDVISRWLPKTLELVGAEPYGITELLVLASPQSLVRPLAKLRRDAPKFDHSPNRRPEVDSIAAMDDLLGSMDSRRTRSSSSTQGPRLLDVTEVAVLSLLFEIVPKES